MEFAIVVVVAGMTIGVISSCYSVTVSQLRRRIEDIEDRHKEQRASDKAKLEKIQEVLDEWPPPTAIPLKCCESLTGIPWRYRFIWKMAGASTSC